MIGVIGGTGLYSLSEDLKELKEPYTSVDTFQGKIADKDILFIPRHGKDHRYSPSNIPSYGIMNRMQDAGVNKILGVCAVGSLKLTPKPGSMVVPAQIIDLTFKRAQTIIPGVTHLSFAKPFCETLRTNLIGMDSRLQPEGVVVVIEGPRFATEAESRFYALSLNADMINMTLMPEALLARELGMCYAALAVVTDYDSGVQVKGEPVTYDEVVRVFNTTIDDVKEILFDFIAYGDLDYSCESCSTAPAKARL